MEHWPIGHGSVFRQHLNNSMNIVWFNGPSTRQFLKIPKQKIEIGCNFIQHHRQVDHVCAYDKQCVAKIPNKKDTKFWTRAFCVNPSYPHFLHFQSSIRYLDSGTMAMCVAANHCDGPVYVLGCDWAESDASIYDKLYTWRDWKPGKQSKDKLNVISAVAKEKTFIFVHERPKDYFGNDIQWIKPQEFSELTA